MRANHGTPQGERVSGMKRDTHISWHEIQKEEEGSRKAAHGRLLQEGIAGKTQ